VRIVAECDARVKVGDRFDRWLVLGRAFRLKSKWSVWTAVVCQCDCGTVGAVREGQLVFGKSHSCGCGKAQKQRELHTKHGMCGTRLYSIWKGVIGRCCNKNHTGYWKYGGRGISICEEWREFPPFRDWATANGYDDLLTIERENNDGNYEPGNCRWATTAEQNLNTRQNNRITAFGETKCLSEWMRDERRVVKPVTVKRRFYLGWPIEKAILTPLLRGANKSRVG
jgi:hypothetical protein